MEWLTNIKLGIELVCLVSLLVYGAGRWVGRGERSASVTGAKLAKIEKRLDATVTTQQCAERTGRLAEENDRAWKEAHVARNEGNRHAIALAAIAPELKALTARVDEGFREISGRLGRVEKALMNGQPDT